MTILEIPQGERTWESDPDSLRLFPHRVMLSTKEELSLSLLIAFLLSYFHRILMRGQHFWFAHVGHGLSSPKGSSPWSPLRYAWYGLGSQSCASLMGHGITRVTIVCL